MKEVRGEGDREGEGRGIKEGVRRGRDVTLVASHSLPNGIKLMSSYFSFSLFSVGTSASPSSMNDDGLLLFFFEFCEFSLNCSCCGSSSISLSICSLSFRFAGFVWSSFNCKPITFASTFGVSPP